MQIKNCFFLITNFLPHPPPPHWRIVKFNFFDRYRDLSKTVQHEVSEVQSRLLSFLYFRKYIAFPTQQIQNMYFYNIFLQESPFLIEFRVPFRMVLFSIKFPSKLQYHKTRICSFFIYTVVHNFSIFFLFPALSFNKHCLFS